MAIMANHQWDHSWFSDNDVDWETFSSSILRREESTEDAKTCLECWVLSLRLIFKYQWWRDK
jgi:hypothetical protein